MILWHITCSLLPTFILWNLVHCIQRTAKPICIPSKALKAKTDTNNLIAKELSSKWRNAAPIPVDAMGPNNFTVLYLSYCLGKVWGYRSQVDRDASLAVWSLTSRLQKVHTIDRPVFLYFPVVSSQFRHQACGGYCVHYKMVLVQSHT